MADLFFVCFRVFLVMLNKLVKPKAEYSNAPWGGQGVQINGVRLKICLPMRPITPLARISVSMEILQRRLSCY